MIDRPTAGPPSGPEPSPPLAPCAGCGHSASRRDFLRETASLVACVAGLGAVPGKPLRLITALAARGDEAVYPIPAQDGATVDREREVIVARFQGRIYAFVLWCPHQRTPLRWQDSEQAFRCPKHKSAFQPDGTFLTGRATRAMDRYPLRREGDTVIVDLATRFQEDTDVERWADAVVVLQS